MGLCVVSDSALAPLSQLFKLNPSRNSLAVQQQYGFSVF